MQILKSNNNLDKYISDIIFCKMNLFFSKIEIEIPKGKVLHYDIDVIIVLENLFDRRKEGMISQQSNQLTLQYIIFFYLLLINYLHRIALMCLFLLR